MRWNGVWLFSQQSPFLEHFVFFSISLEIYTQSRSVVAFLLPTHRFLEQVGDNGGLLLTTASDHVLLSPFHSTTVEGYRDIFDRELPVLMKESAEAAGKVDTLRARVLLLVSEEQDREAVLCV